MTWRVAYWYIRYRIDEVFGYQSLGAELVKQMMLSEREAKP